MKMSWLALLRFASSRCQVGDAGTQLEARPEILAGISRAMPWRARALSSVLRSCSRSACITPPCRACHGHPGESDTPRSASFLHQLRSRLAASGLSGTRQIVHLSAPDTRQTRVANGVLRSRNRVFAWVSPSSRVRPCKMCAMSRTMGRTGHEPKQPASRAPAKTTAALTSGRKAARFRSQR